MWIFICEFYDMKNEKLKNAGIAKGEEKGIAERVGEEKRGKWESW